MNKKLENKVAVITGGSSGIGFATAKRFVEEGAYVYIVGRRQEELDKAIARIGNNIRAIRADISKPGDLDNLYKLIADEKGKLDIVFANAAVAQMEPLGLISEAAMDFQLEVNFKGTVFTVQKALPLINDGGSIVITGSIGAIKGLSGQSIYTATKAALRTLVRAWAVELKTRKIRVNMVTPGGFETEGIAALFPDEETRKAMIGQLGASTVIGRIGQPAELANAVVFLASDEASYVDAADFQVDGGIGQV